MKIFKGMAVTDTDSLGELMEDYGLSTVSGCDDSGAPYLFTLDLTSSYEGVTATDASGAKTPGEDLDFSMLWVLVPEEDEAV